MKTQILFAVFFLPAMVFSQKNYAPLGAYWAYEGHSLDCTGFHKTFKVEREVDIDGKDCSVIYSYLSDDLNPEPQPTGDSLIVWEDDNKVFFYDDTAFYLLYDFGAAIGDTVVFYIPLNRGPFSVVCLDTMPETPAQFAAYINNIDEIDISGQTRKSFEVQIISPIFSECADPCLIIENIGSNTESITGDFCGHVAEGCLGGFVCYENPSIKYEPHQLPLNCDFTSGIQQEPSDGEIFIFPNPAKESLSIRLPEHLSIKNIEIYDPVSHLVQSEEVKTSIDIRGLSAGIYIVIVTMTNGHRVSNVIIKP